MPIKIKDGTGYLQNLKVTADTAGYYSLYNVAVETAHNFIHQGKTFFICDCSSSLSTSEKFGLLLHTPTAASGKECHFIYSAIGTKEMLVNFIEAPTIVTTGNALVIKNRDRESSNTSLCAANVATAYTGGTDLCTQVVGTTKSSGGESRGLHEWILKEDTDYVLLMTSNENANFMSYCCTWYEVNEEDLT